MKKNKITMMEILTVLFFCVCMMGCNHDTNQDTNPGTNPGTNPEPEIPANLLGKLIILQAYGSSSSAAGISHSFVELYNITDEEISMDGIGLYYADGTSVANDEVPNTATEDGAWKRISLDGETVPAKGSFLILGSRQSAGARYQIPENSGDINNDDFTLSNRAFKVALLQSTEELTVQNPFDTDGNGAVISGYIDMVGAANEYGGRDLIFGFETAPARNSASEAVRRTDLLDTDNNSANFIAMRYALTGNGALTDEMLQVRKPRSASTGSWDPFEEPEAPTGTVAGNPSPLANKLLIFQVYGTGTATDGAVSHSFIELYNNTDSEINLNAYSLQYANSTGTNWTVINLTGTIPANGSYLVRGNNNNTSGRLQLAAADQDAGFYLNNNGFKVALMANQKKLTVVNPFDMTGGKAEDYIDLIGATNGSNPDAFEGTLLSGAISKQASARRKSFTDTDNNSADFERIDYRTSGTTNEQVDQYKPRTSNEGSWVPQKEFAFSHDSGLYSQQFSLTITAPAGSAIYYSIDGSIPSAEKAGVNPYVFEYSSPITVQNRSGQANILATDANTEQMYMRPDDPRGSAPAIYYPTNNQVPKATVIRAIAVDAVGKKSGVLTKTYFIGYHLTNYSNNRVISLVSDPYNLIDQNYGIMVRGKEENRWDGPNIYNFRQKGQSWEREAYLELFEGNASSRSVPLSTGVGIRVRGGWSRAPGQKSFNVYFKEEYGINNLRDYNLIPGAVKADGKTPVERYKGFMLRNGANDMEYTKFYDVFLQDLRSDRCFTAQAAVPCVVYLNGEYWGPYNLQERYSDNHTEYKYGVAKENVISFDNGELDDGNPGEESLFWQMMNMRNNDMSNPANYNAFCAVFDIENFIDYWAAQIYIYNEDWPHNNYRLWRTRNAEPGNPYDDTKWRWQMFDTEFALGIYNGGGLTGQSGKDAFDKILNGDSRDHHNNRLFKALLANADFCRRFVNTMLDLYNVNFHPDSFTPKLNNYTAIYGPLMGDNNTTGTYFSRWGGWSGQFQSKVNDARTYLTDIRNKMVSNYLPKYFGGYSDIANIGISSGNLYNVTISTTGVSGVSIKINTVTTNLASGSWTGEYYAGNPITVTASAPPNGYEFDGWTVAGGNAETPSALTTTVNITGNAQITAKYKLK
jgi:hypothetical protein